MPILVLFQDEARFGRMSDPARCWAPYPIRPIVQLALVREFRYCYAAIGPQKGTLDWMVCDSMKTEEMSRFLKQVGKAHPRNHVVMVLDGASSHRALALEIPKNISLIRLPPYSPELNPVEILWHELRGEALLQPRLRDTCCCPSRSGSRDEGTGWQHRSHDSPQRLELDHRRNCFECYLE